MFGYLCFGLTVLVYFVLCVFVLQPAPSGGDQTYGWAYSAFMLMAAYIVCSLLLTINITVNGGFDWISNAAIKRNICVGIFWLVMIAGVYYCGLGRPEYHKFYPLTGNVRLLSHIIYYGAIWLPLFMLIPYLLFLKPEWRETLSPILYKIPLILGCVLGLLLIISPKIMSGILKSYKAFDENELAFNKAMKNIDGYQDVMSLLYYTSEDYDVKIRDAALHKIKATKKWEDEMIGILERSTPYGVYNFLVENKIEHPERFIEPIIKSFSTIIADMHEDLINPYKNRIFKVGILLKVLDEQFNDNIAVFKPHILKLQEVMETPPAKSRAYGDVKEFNETLYKYREEIKNWLARH